MFKNVHNDTLWYSKDIQIAKHVFYTLINVKSLIEIIFATSQKESTQRILTTEDRLQRNTHQLIQYMDYKTYLKQNSKPLRLYKANRTPNHRPRPKVYPIQN